MKLQRMWKRVGNRTEKVIFPTCDRFGANATASERAHWRDGGGRLYRGSMQTYSKRRMIDSHSFSNTPATAFVDV